MLSSFNNNPFCPHTPPWSTPEDLDWWQHQLHRSNISTCISKSQPLTNYEAYSDASSGFGMVITIGLRWRAWWLVDGWKSRGQKPSALSYWPSVYAPFQVRANTSYSMATIEESLKDGGSTAVPTNPPTRSSATLSNYWNLVVKQFTQNTS